MLEEVIVTAQKRAQRLTDVPLSVSVVTAGEIDARGLLNSGDYLRGMPGVNQLDSALNQTIVIRGIESATTFQNFGSGPTTATYFGETPTTNAAGLFGGTNVDIKLVDVERVEVLRGPQGTAFGNSSLGGAVRTIPVAPKLDRFEGALSGNYSVTADSGGDNHMTQGVANIPLVLDRFAVRATAYQFADSGYYQNRAGSDAAFRAAAAGYGALASSIDEDEVGSYSVKGGRIAALFQATDDLRLTVSYLAQRAEADGVIGSRGSDYRQTEFQVSPEHAIAGRSGGYSNIDIDLANVTMEYALGWAGSYRARARPWAAWSSVHSRACLATVRTRRTRR
jgi:outer membrane receptor protein involved in Fe transport